MHNASSIRLASLVVLLTASLPISLAQNSAPPAAASSSAVPKLVNYSGVLPDLSNRSAVVGITFLLYKDQQGGSPLWLETQNIQPDRTGHYTATLGATTVQGLPTDLFATGEARWLAVQPAGQPEQPRVLLVAVPYAMKAKDAETIGGLPPSAFVLAAPPITAAAPENSPGANSSTDSAPPPATSNVTTSGGTVNTLSLFTTSKNIQSSALTQTGSGTTSRIGINTTTPTTTLDVKGGTVVRGVFTLPATGTATSTAGKPSQPENFVASSFNSATNKAVPQIFEWRAEQANNNTASPSATLNLLYGSGSATPTETGVRIGPKGVISFSPSQTFPRTGTITGVAAGTDLTGGGTTGKVTLNLDLTRVPQLHAANTFVGNQAITGNVAVNGVFNNPALMVKASEEEFGIEAFGGGGASEFAGGGSGVLAFGGAETNTSTLGGDGVDAYGGVADQGGLGIYAQGADSRETGGADGIDATAGNGPQGAGYSGFFQGGTVNVLGDLGVSGQIFAGTKDFRIDHPLDPANKYLYHASVESSEMTNIYSGNIALDTKGSATVTLPTWFEALNTDFRYQLTAIGAAAPNLHVAREVANHQFSIAGGAPGMKVSWQVTGIRHDPYALANPLTPEVAKSSNERGFYLHPALYGQPDEKQIEWGRHPAKMHRLQQLRTAHK